ncbi:acyl-coenzyme A:6-aminopenicillanic acid acyl-transferase [Kordia sp. SMS9]|uniref:C45 family autoproteolytic acyltransferase/hydolase n=1 Tax=Kordia sp. SMS9 TaxID=2282170 RepID=UPI000E0D370B|nr:C45 family autoproteolytic acyltransferase/hydolase [Kordia sp. SMS9]AXG68763.1 acyl-coenzyme A:6-aminopenicillanic acid acyl-transferase [Kordia sp. SMS9]
MKTHIVNLDLQPSKRWSFLSKYKTAVNELIQCYLDDFTGAEFIFEGVELYKEQFISETYIQEIQSIAEISNFSVNEILVANLYYDVLKLYFGCTAFATWNDNEMFHARNLDWHTDENILSTHSMIFDFQKAGKTIFKSVGWPGFVGVLSAIKPRKFAITLNAVLSEDQAELALPISFVLRDVLETCESFEEAKTKLENTPIICDCLLLLSGTKHHEKVVIERTPKRTETRISEEGFIVVTNDYKQLQNGRAAGNILQATSCGRFDSTTTLLRANKVQQEQQCLEVLQHQNVMMGITMQQMVFTVNTGEIKLICT